jgi:hypothetical protein
MAEITCGWSALRFTRRATTWPPPIPIVEKPGDVSGWPVIRANSAAVG